LDRIEALMKKLVAQTAPRQPSEDSKVFKALSSKYWNGDDYTGNKFSECAPEFLRAMAKYRGACVWAAKKKYSETKDEKELEYVSKNEATAKLATAWAEYHEASGSAEPAPVRKAAPQAGDEYGLTDDTDVPF